MSGNERDGDGHDDYLWDRRGPVDPEIARLEGLLRGHGHDGRPHRLRPPSADTAPGRRRRPRRLRIAFAAAAVLALCAIGSQAWYRHRLQWEAGRPWQVLAQQGEARIEGKADGGVASFVPGAVLATGDDALVRLRAARIGEVVLGADSRLQLRETRTGRHRLQLLQGRMWARVWAPPGQFGVGVAGADMFDLGCEFLVHSNADGEGTLTVRSGWVQVEAGMREVLVPEGASVRLHGRRPPGTPRDLRASPGFVAALDAIDARLPHVDPRGADVRRLVSASREGDVISLVSLLARNPALAEGPLYERIVQLLPDAPPVTREEIRARGGAALGPWWDALPYPRIKRWWMQWPDVLPAGNEAEALLRSGPTG